MADGEIVYSVKVDSSGAIQEIRQAGDELGSQLNDKASSHSSTWSEVWIGAARQIGAEIVNLGAQAAQALGSAVVSITKDAVAGYAEYEQLIGGVETLFGDSAGTIEEYANNAYKTAGLSANEYMSTVTSFSASLLQSLGGDTAAAASYAQVAVTDMSDNANKMGTSMESIQNAYQGFAKQNYTMLDNLKLGYGGTKTEMERLIADAEGLNSSFKASKDANGDYALSFSDVVDAIHIVQENMGITGTTAKEASTTIEGSLNSTKAAWSNLLVGLADDNANFESLITNFIDNALNSVDLILPRIQNALNGVVTLIGELAPEIIALVPQLVESLLPVIVGIIPDILSAVGEIITALVNYIIENLPAITQAGVDLLMGLMEGIGSNPGQVMSTILQVISILLTTLLNNLPQLLSAGAQMINSILHGLAQNIPQIMSLIGDLIKSLLDIWMNTDWLGIGRALIDGIISGLNSGWNWLMDTVRSLASSVLKAAKNMLGIASPSKEFKFIGRMTTIGMEEGIEQDVPDLERTVTTLYSSVVDDAAAALSAGTNVSAYDVGDIERNISTNLTAIASTPDQTINVPLYLDGREIARATAWYTGEQLAWLEA